MKTLPTDIGAADTLPKALEVALTKTAVDQFPTTAGFWRRIRNPEQRPAHDEPHPELVNGKQLLLPDSKATVQTFVDSLPLLATFIGAPFDSNQPEICPPEELIQLLSIQARQDAILAKLAEYSNTNISNYLNGQRDAYHAALAEGKDVSSLVVESRETVGQKFRTAQSGLTALLLKITHEELIPVARPALQRFEALLESIMQEQEEIDRQMCQAYAIDYQPGLLWKVAATVAIQYIASRRLPASHAWTTPKALLAGIVEI